MQASPSAHPTTTSTCTYAPATSTSSPTPTSCASTPRNQTCTSTSSPPAPNPSRSSTSCRSSSPGSTLPTAATGPNDSCVNSSSEDCSERHSHHRFPRRVARSSRRGHQRPLPSLHPDPDRNMGARRRHDGHRPRLRTRHPLLALIPNQDSDIVVDVLADRTVLSATTQTLQAQGFTLDASIGSGNDVSRCTFSSYKSQIDVLCPSDATPDMLDTTDGCAASPSPADAGPCAAPDP